MSSKSPYGQTFAGLIMYGCKKSYWDWVPREIQEHTVSFVVSQELIGARNKDSWKAFCLEIHQYGQLKVKWGLEPLVLKHQNCGLYYYKGRILNTNKHLTIFGKYEDINYDMQQEFLSYSFKEALARADHAKLFLYTL